MKRLGRLCVLIQVVYLTVIWSFRVTQVDYCSLLTTLYNTMANYNTHITVFITQDNVSFYLNNWKSIFPLTSLSCFLCVLLTILPG